MAIPKTVTKIHRSNGHVTVEYKDSCDQANYFMNELSRGALRDVAKFIRAEFKNRYYAKFKRETGDAGKVTRSTVYSSKNTKYPRVDIGIKVGKADGFYAYFQEFGTSKGKYIVPRYSILQNTVKDNISTIIEIESKYLSALEKDAIQIKGQVDEKEFNDDK